MLMLILPILACCAYFLSISIHLMLMLIFLRTAKQQQCTNFNTSHVNVNPKSQADSAKEIAFQYISC